MFFENVYNVFGSQTLPTSAPQLSQEVPSRHLSPAFMSLCLFDTVLLCVVLISLFLVMSWYFFLISLGWAYRSILPCLLKSDLFISMHNLPKFTHILQNRGTKGNDVLLKLLPILLVSFYISCSYIYNYSMNGCKHLDIPYYFQLSLPMSLCVYVNSFFI